MAPERRWSGVDLPGLHPRSIHPRSLQALTLRNSARVRRENHDSRRSVL